MANKPGGAAAADSGPGRKLQKQKTMLARTLDTLPRSLTRAGSEVRRYQPVFTRIITFLVPDEVSERFSTKAAVLLGFLVAMCSLAIFIGLYVHFGDCQVETVLQKQNTDSTCKELLLTQTGEYAIDQQGSWQGQTGFHTTRSFFNLVLDNADVSTSQVQQLVADMAQDLHNFLDDLNGRQGSHLENFQALLYEMDIARQVDAQSVGSSNHSTGTVALRFAFSPQWFFASQVPLYAAFFRNATAYLNGSMPLRDYQSEFPASPRPLQCKSELTLLSKPLHSSSTQLAEQMDVVTLSISEGTVQLQARTGSAVAVTVVRRCCSEDEAESEPDRCDGYTSQNDPGSYFPGVPGEAIEVSEFANDPAWGLFRFESSVPVNSSDSVLLKQAMDFNYMFIHYDPEQLFALSWCNKNWALCVQRWGLAAGDSEIKLPHAPELYPSRVLWTHNVTGYLWETMHNPQKFNASLIVVPEVIPEYGCLGSDCAANSEMSRSWCQSFSVFNLHFYNITSGTALSPQDIAYIGRTLTIVFSWPTRTFLNQGMAQAVLACDVSALRFAGVDGAADDFSSDAPTFPREPPFETSTAIFECEMRICNGVASRLAESFANVELFYVLVTSFVLLTVLVYATAKAIDSNLHVRDAPGAPNAQKGAHMSTPPGSTSSHLPLITPPQSPQALSGLVAATHGNASAGGGRILSTELQTTHSLEASAAGAGYTLHASSSLEQAPTLAVVSEAGAIETSRLSRTSRDEPHPHSGDTSQRPGRGTAQDDQRQSAPFGIHLDLV